jgi:biopolymer transport protein ExbB
MRCSVSRVIPAIARGFVRATFGLWLVCAAEVAPMSLVVAEAQTVAPGHTPAAPSTPSSEQPVPPPPSNVPSAEMPQVEADATLPRDLSPWGMFMAADHLVQAVMILLALASVLSWTVWLAKSFELFGAKRRAQRAVRTLAEARTLHEGVERLRRSAGPVAAFVRAAEWELRLSADALDKDGVKERVASRIERIEAAAARRMNRGTGILATIGAIGPFVGLFGTVWGIMNSFIGISRAQTTNLAVVAPGIAEALLATALGLAAAIPAVVIFNVFSRSIAGYRGLLGDGAAEVMRLVSRDLDRALSTQAGATDHHRLAAAAE